LKFFLLISASKVHRRAQPTAATFNKMHGALRALHVSLNNASIWKLSESDWKRTKAT